MSRRKLINVEICKSEYIDGKWNIRIGDVRGSTEISNATFDEVLNYIKEEMEEIAKAKLSP